MVVSRVLSRSLLPVWIGALGCLLPSCKDPGGSPAVPEPETSETASGADARAELPVEEELPSIDGAGTSTPAAPETGNASNLVLPKIFSDGIDACQRQSRYYDLRLGTCTETALADFACDLNQLLATGSTTLTAGQKTKLREYVDTNIPGFSLYACTREGALPVLHFYKVETDRIRAHNVKVVNSTSP